MYCFNGKDREKDRDMKRIRHRMKGARDENTKEKFSVEFQLVSPVVH
jgi:hypothetical protein